MCIISAWLVNSQSIGQAIQHYQTAIGAQEESIWCWISGGMNKSPIHGSLDVLPVWQTLNWVKSGFGSDFYHPGLVWNEWGRGLTGILLKLTRSSLNCSPIISAKYTETSSKLILINELGKCKNVTFYLNTSVASCMHHKRHIFTPCPVWHAFEEKV